jgi:hypothetical protein
MPSKVRRLKQLALEACKERGHNMRNFVQHIPAGHYSRPRYYTSACRWCGMQVEVIPNPYPNEIDIGGRAISLKC